MTMPNRSWMKYVTTTWSKKRTLHLRSKNFITEGAIRKFVAGKLTNIRAEFLRIIQLGGRLPEMHELEISLSTNTCCTTAANLLCPCCTFTNRHPEAITWFYGF